MQPISCGFLPGKDAHITDATTSDTNIDKKAQRLQLFFTCDRNRRAHSSRLHCAFGGGAPLSGNTIHLGKGLSREKMKQRKNEPMVAARAARECGLGASPIRRSTGLQLPSPVGPAVIRLRAAPDILLRRARNKLQLLTSQGLRALISHEALQGYRGRS